jgi:hypothetical protein
MSLYVSVAPAWLSRPQKGFLSDAEIASLNALFAGLLPADHARQIPGAVEAGAGTFVSQLLAMDPSVYVEIPAWQTLYRAALPALEGYARATFQKALTDLSEAELAQLIGGLEAATLTGLPAGLEQKTLFTTLRRHCIQGCFADPRWGGNRDRIMWRAIGYLQPPEDLYRE